MPAAFDPDELNRSEQSAGSDRYGGNYGTQYGGNYGTNYGGNYGSDKLKDGENNAPSFYTEGPGEHDSPSLRSRIFRGRRRKAAIGSALVVLIAAAVISVIIGVLPLKILHIVNNLQARFYATAENAVEKETEKLFSTYVLGKMLAPGCRGAVIDHNCNPYTGNSLVMRLYRGWSDGRLEEKLRKQTGLEIRRTAGGVYLRFAGGEDINIDALRENKLISEIIDADGNYTRVQRHKLKGIFKSALKSQTRYSAAMFYTKVTPFLARKYASIWCVIGCDKKDRYDKWKNDKKLGAKMWLAERVLGPRAELYTYLTKCLYAPDQCTPDKVIEASEKGTYRTAVEGCEDGCGRDNGAHKSPVLNNMEIAMLAKATSFGSDHNKLSQLFNSFEREGFISRLFTLYDKNAAIQDKADQISEAKFDEEGVDEDTQRRARDKDVDRSNVSIFRTLGYIYWAALIFKTIDELPQMVAKMNYDINSMNMAQVWDMYRTVPDEGHKEGETDAELYGSFVTSLGPGLQPVDGESGDKQVGGTAGAECSPLYHALISNGPNEPAGSGVSRISDCKDYICADGNPLAAEELVCDEEKLHGRSDFVAALDSVKVLPGWKYLANASSFIVNTVNALFSELVSIITSVLPFLNDLLNFLANAAMKLADWAQLDEVFKHLAKWILGVNVNLISNNMSGARTFNLMAGGADVSGNAFSHNGIGGVALKPGQIQANLEYYQEKQLAEYRQKSFFAQMTDTESPYSPAGRLALTLPSNSVAVANSINNTWTDFIKNPFAKLTNIATSIFSPRASASGFVPGKDPFGVTQYGYPLDDPFFKENPDEYWKKYCVSNLPNGDRNPSYLTDEWNLFAAENVNNSETYQPENIQTTEFQRIVPSNKYGTNGCLLIQTAVASAGIIFTDEVLSDEELAELNPPTGGGGSIDCSSYVNTTWGQINTNGSMMPDTPPDEFRQIIVDQAPGRSCPDWKLSEHLPANVLSRLVPNNEHEYYANCSRSSAQPDTCYVNTGSDGRRYIEVKYRDPPVSGSDTHKVYLDGGGNNPPTEPPPTQPPCRGDVCYD